MSEAPMTRINAGVLPEELPDKMLLAEHREIKRIPNAIKSGRYSMVGVPTKFTLGTGHVKWFYSRQQYLYSRYHSIYFECIKRGFNVQDYSACWQDLPAELCNDWTPTEEDRQLIVDRINSKGFTLIER